MKKLFGKILNLIPRPILINLSNVFQPVVAWFFKGERFEDPIDEKTYYSFLPYGYEKQRSNALSPGTFSLERHRLLWLYLKNNTDFFQNQYKVLHIAPEQAFYKKFKNMLNLDYTTADLNSPLADVKADVTNLPFPDETFDVVFCNHVFEHVEDDKKAMSELYRVMKFGAWGVFQVPIRYQLEETIEDSSVKTKRERKEKFGQYDHLRVYGLDYYNRLEEIGFEVHKIDYTKELTEEQIKRYGLEKGEILPLVKKVNQSKSSFKNLSEKVTKVFRKNN